MENIKPLNITIRRCVIKGQMYDLTDYSDFVKMTENNPENVPKSIGILEDYKGDSIVLPYRGKYNERTNSNPGIYDAGIINIEIYPEEADIASYRPRKIVELNNKSSIKDILEKEEVIARLDEPWITSPDNITQFNITEEDRPEMVCLKTALNKKKIDIDLYSSRFGDNFPNDKRQLKNNGATLNIIKRFCKCMDMEAILILRDKNSNVPNPMGTEVVVSLTEDYSDDE